jgi:hypothetical protein
MRMVLCLAVVALTAAGREDKRSITVDIPAIVGEQAAPLLAVYTLDHGLRPRRTGPQVLVAVWSDGRVVWSKDDREGGPPYREGRIPVERVRKLLDAQAATGVFGDAALDRAHFGPDSHFTVIAAADGRRRLCLRSWHELFEANPNLVATEGGVTALEGRDRAAVLAAQPEAYRRYRRTWADLRAAIRGLIPAEGRDAGELRFELRQIRDADEGK